MVDTLSGALVNILWFLGDVAVKWVPATVGTLTGTAPGASAPITLLTNPVTIPQTIAYIEQSSPYAGSLYHYWIELVSIGIVLTLFFAAIIVYCAIRLREIREHELERMLASAHPVAARDISRTQLRWNHILEEANSEDERRWRLAILEADIMLNELLDVQGYRGETMADKMKRVDRIRFRSIDSAWEAHRARNQVAHQGSAYILTQGEVRRIMALYEGVFREFTLIE